MTDSIKLRLVMDVVFSPNGTPPDQLIDALSTAGADLVSAGVIAGSSSASIIEVSTSVEDMTPKARHHHEEQASGSDAVIVPADDEFITVPEVTLPNGVIVPSFKVGKFVCSPGEESAAGAVCEDLGDNVRRKAAVTAQGLPWVNIDYHDAREACTAAGYTLLTETQWLAIAWDAANVDENWTGGKVGKGAMYQGLRDGTVRRAQPGTFEPSEASQRRWKRLSNGEVIFDIGGNVWQWIFDDVQGNQSGIIKTAFAKDSVSLMAPAPSEKKGMGWRPDAGADWSGYAPVRGGYWSNGSDAGPFRLDYNAPSGTNSSIGFRGTK